MHVDARRQHDWNRELITVEENKNMKKLSFSIITLALLVGFTTCKAQGPISVINGGTNLAVISLTDTTDSPIIANVYAGQNYTVANAGGGTNVVSLTNPSGSSYTTFTNSSGGISQIQKPGFAPSGYRICVNICNQWTNSIGIKFSGTYPTGAPPDRVILALTSQSFYFEDGYNGSICARTFGAATVGIGGGSLTYSDWGN